MLGLNFALIVSVGHGFIAGHLPQPPVNHYIVQAPPELGSGDELRGYPGVFDSASQLKFASDGTAVGPYYLGKWRKTEVNATTLLYFDSTKELGNSVSDGAAVGPYYLGKWRKTEDNATTILYFDSAKELGSSVSDGAAVGPYYLGKWRKTEDNATGTLYFDSTQELGDSVSDDAASGPFSLGKWRKTEDNATTILYFDSAKELGSSVSDGAAVGPYYLGKWRKTEDNATGTLYFDSAQQLGDSVSDGAAVGPYYLGKWRKTEDNATTILYFDSAKELGSSVSDGAASKFHIKSDTPSNRIAPKPHKFQETVESVIASLQFGYDKEQKAVNPAFENRVRPHYAFDGNAVNGFANKFESLDSMTHFLNQEAHAEPGRKVWVADPRLMEKEMEIFSVDNITWSRVLLTCHANGLFICHRPFKAQNFMISDVRSKLDGVIGRMLFAEHLMDPSCQHNCEWMHHAVEYVLWTKDLEPTEFMV